ncbi:acyl-CoA N-acyltransferase [Lipomyces oligophaga]|uniref:acyl-CoA N-acyltransferase n=1 Tax=Lipomyces oligophaga TaxID=45792 RepID=UPI0034CD2CF6
MGDIVTSGDGELLEISNGSTAHTSKEDASGPRNVNTVVFGQEYEFEAWYGCSYYSNLDNARKKASTPGPIIDKLYVCNRCFKYTLDGSLMGQHLLLCAASFSPKGRLVYQYNQFSIREVDGAKDKLYCQLLCLFSKLFLDTKSVCFAVDRFTFYVLIHHSSAKSEQAVGFFSKEKLSWDQNNLACVAVFPPFQGQGLGQILIEFSYELSIIDGVLGSPERPLSKSGKRSYLLFWRSSIARALSRIDCQSGVSIDDLSHATGIRQDDIVEALVSLKALHKGDNSLWSIDKAVIIAWAAENKINLNRPSLIDVNYISL